MNAARHVTIDVSLANNEQVGRCNTVLHRLLAAMACTLASFGCVNCSHDAPTHAWEHGSTLTRAAFRIGDLRKQLDGEQLALVEAALPSMTAVEPLDRTSSANGWLDLDFADQSKLQLLFLYTGNEMFYVADGWKWRAYPLDALAVSLWHAARLNHTDPAWQTVND